MRCAVGRASVRPGDICKTVGTNRYLEEIEQLARATAAKDTHIADWTLVRDMIAGLGDAEHRFAISCVERLREKDVPPVAG